MINLDRFHAACKVSIGRDPNNEQKEALNVSAQSPLFIVAGPGTGKTACLTLRILKLVLVDRVPPRGVLATTFTKKAAAELRSRILSWGFKMIEHFKNDVTLPEPTRTWCAQLDINQTLTGTIDSICEQLLRDHRDLAALPPVLADDFVAKTLLLREGLLGGNRFKDTFLKLIYRPGYRYRKAGVMLAGILKQGYRQQDLFSPLVAAKEDQPLMAALDKINGKWGRHTIQYGMSAEAGKPCSMHQARKSPAYTTNWHELPLVKAAE